MEDQQFGALLFLGDGRIRITWHDDTTSTLRRPTKGQFQESKLRIRELQDDFRAGLNLARDLPAEDLEGRKALIVKANDELAAACVAWWRQVVQPLADRPFPDDDDDWPAEMVLGEGVLLKVSDWWQFIPWDRGLGTAAASTAITTL